MKKKSIFVVALAALMLIAFTACEQPANIWNPNGKVPTNAVITQTGDWFVSGQTFDPSRFSVAITYADGSSETVSGTNLVQLDAKATPNDKARNYVLPGDGVKATVGTTTASGSSVTAPVNAVGTLNVAAIDSVTITGPAEKTIENGKANVAVAASEYTVAIGYTTPAGKQTMTLEPSDYTLTVKSGNDKVKFGNFAKGTYTLTAEVTFASGTAIKTSDAFSLEVKEYSAPTTWDGTKLIVEVQDETPNGSFHYVQRAEVSAAMVRVWQSNDGKTKLDEITSGFTVKPTTALKDNPTRFNETASQTITVSYDYTDPITGAITPVTQASEVIKTRADYPTAMSVVSSTTAESAIANGTVHKDNTTISILATAWKSGMKTAEGGDKQTSGFSIEYTPEKATNTVAGSTTEVPVTYVITMTTKYSDSNKFEGSFTEYVSGPAVVEEP